MSYRMKHGSVSVLLFTTIALMFLTLHSFLPCFSFTGSPHRPLTSLHPFDASEAAVARGSRASMEDGGGCYYDDFGNASGLELQVNSTVMDGRVRLDGHYPDDTWLYGEWDSRREVIISNPSSGTLAGYEVPLHLWKLEGMQPDFDDIRFSFYNPGNRTEIPLHHWIESRVDGKWADVWVKVPELLPHDVCCLFMYYENYLASDASDGEGTFLFFDNFHGSNLDTLKWVQPELDRYRRFSVAGGSLELEIVDTYSASIACQTVDLMDITGRMVEQRQRSETGGTPSGTWTKAGTMGMRMMDEGVTWKRWIGRGTTDNNWLKYSRSYDTDDTIWEQPDWDGSMTDYETVGYCVDGNTVSIYENYEEVTSITDNGIDDRGLSLAISNNVAGYDGDGYGQLYVDWFRIRNHASPEPQFHLNMVNGILLSTPIVLPAGMRWDTVSFDKHIPDGTSMNFSVLRSDTREPLPGLDGLGTRKGDLSPLNGMNLTSIRLRVNMTGTGRGTPELYGWGVSWVSENIFHDSFVGCRYLDMEENVDANGKVTLRDTAFEGVVRSTPIILGDDLIWSELRAGRRVPGGAFLNISILDAGTGEVLAEDFGQTESVTMELSSLHPVSYRSIILEARLSSSTNITPILDFWSVVFSVDDVSPIAIAGEDVAVGQYENITLNGNASYDNVGISLFQWEFLYLGEHVKLGEKVVSFKMERPGEYGVTLTVADESGNRDTDNLTIVVRDITLPTADAGPDILTDQHSTVMFDGSGSSDNVGIENYTWTFDDQGLNVTLFGVRTEHLFEIPGIYEVNLSVTDSHGNLHSDVKYVSIRDITLPIARAGSDITVLNGSKVILSANASSDDSSIINYTWMFSHGGKFEVLYGKNCSFIFDRPGSYVINLRVVDAGGNEDSDTLTVIVTEKDTENASSDEDRDSDGDGYNDTCENASGSDPYNARSTPIDWDGDGVPNEKDAYPHDPTRWSKERSLDLLTLMLLVGAGGMIVIISIFIYSRIKSANILDNSTRHNILRYIEAYPGRHYNEMRRDLGVSRGTLTHHLRKLEGEGMVRSKRVSKYKYYYPFDQTQEIHDLTPAEKDIVELIRKNPGSTTKMLSQRYGRKPRTIYHHVNNLTDLGIVDGRKVDGEYQWYLVLDPGVGWS